MNQENALRRIVLCVLLGMLPLLAPGAFAQNADEFWSKFQKAYADGNAEAMKNAVVLNPQGAILVFLDKVERFTVDMDDAVGKEVDALRQAWEAAFHNQFFENQYKYLSFLDADTRRKRKEMIGNWNKMRVLFEETKGTAKADNWDTLERILPSVVESFEAIGDLYHGSWAVYNLAQSYDPSYRPKDAKGLEALENYRKFLQFRERIDLKDGAYQTVKQIMSRLEKLYQAAQPGAVPGDPSGIPYRPDSQWTELALTAATAEPGGDPDRFGYDDDEIYTLWPRVQIVDNKAATLPGFPTAVSLVREGITKFSLDHDGDGKGDVKLKASGRPELIEFPRSLGPATDKYAIWITTGGSQVLFQRVETNLAPTENLANFYYRSASVRTGAFQEVPFRIFDENADGRYNSEVFDRTVDGMLKPLPVLDSWAMGKDKRAAPVSAYAKFADKWYRVEFDTKYLGGTMRLREVVAQEGTLALDFKGPSSLYPASLIVRAVGSYQGGFFEIAGNKKGVQLPAGGYELFCGLIRMGKGPRSQKAVILRGSAQGVIVEPGKTTTLKIGEPFAFDFQWKQEGEKITVPGKTVTVVGSAGETYEMIWEEVPTPDVHVRVGGRPLGKPTDTRRATQEHLTQSNDWSILWHPLDAEIEVPKDADKIEVRLVEKHKWFGKLESPWK